VGDRVPGTSVLTLRYLKPGFGWAIAPSGSATGSTITADAQGIVTSISLNPLTGEKPASYFSNGDVAMLADCSNAQVFKAAFDGTTLTPDTTAGANYALPLDVSKGAAPRLFDFSKDFQTVTYYLKVVCVDGRNPCTGPTTGELVRRVNGTDNPLVRGVERMDFLYGVIDADGDVQFLTANEVDEGKDSDGNSIPCPPGVGTDGGMGNAGCLWRAVQTIEVHILMDGQTPLYTLTPAEMKYIYSPDGDAEPEAASAHDIKPDADQGFPLQVLRREFTTVVALRNFNP
jgi:type IV pilus assembly protein PilW